MEVRKQQSPTEVEPVPLIPEVRVCRLLGEVRADVIIFRAWELPLLSTSQSRPLPHKDYGGSLPPRLLVLRLVLEELLELWRETSAHGTPFAGKVEPDLYCPSLS